ncbi:plasmid recombination protein [Glutamicibacter ardleyensis]|uniref:plasmid recombination protein n=1 Tax=Glutamicibacter ardleyensis TaxID=225894 RepID=UPI003FD15C81
MSYTATFDASHKVKVSGGHRVNFMRHIARDADEKAGFKFPQRNQNIDPARTSMNITMVNDGKGGWRVPVPTPGAKGALRPPSAELDDYLDSRFATLKRKPKADAVALRPMILQLDPKWFDEHNQDWRVNGLNHLAKTYIDAQLGWAALEFSPDRRNLKDRKASNANLVGYSIHLDETSPQLQLMFAPVTDDGRLSQKDFFKGPGDLKRQHKEHRQTLADVGYDVEFSVTALSKERLSSSEFAKKADEARAQEQENREWSEELDDADRTNDEWGAELMAQKKAQDAKARELVDRESKLHESEAALQPLVAEIEQGHADLKHEQDKFGQEQRIWMSEKLPKLRKNVISKAEEDAKPLILAEIEHVSAQAKAEIQPQLDTMIQQAKDEANKESRRLRKVKPDVQRYLDAHPKVKEHFAAWQSKQPEPEAQQRMVATVAKVQKDVAAKEPSIFDTFRADVNDDEHDSDRDRGH